MAREDRKIKERSEECRLYHNPPNTHREWETRPVKGRDCTAIQLGSNYPKEAHKKKEVWNLGNWNFVPKLCWRLQCIWWDGLLAVFSIIIRSSFLPWWVDANGDNNECSTPEQCAIETILKWITQHNSFYVQSTTENIAVILFDLLKTYAA